MDDQTDDRNPGIPPVGTPEELEEALKWLENLTARQGKTADVKNQSAAPSLDSPFRGLIDSEDGDLPDWLREVPNPHVDDDLEEAEPESRLDWLSKMAQRESIEELPTLEWRRLSEPTQSAILAAQADNLSVDLPFEMDEESEGLPDDRGRTDETVASTDEISEVEGQITGLPLVDSEAEKSEEENPLPALAEDGDEGIESAAELAQGADIDELTESAASDAPAEAHPETSEFAPDDYLPPMDDLDAAMAWIEELAASQDAPIEEIPSVADRALASKLMMEAGLIPIVSPLDELGSESSLMDSLTPTHPFIEEEDFADTIVLVETLTADQEEEVIEFPAVLEEVEIIEAYERDVVEVDRAVVFALEKDQSFADEEVVEELSFEEAMAYLDEMAGQQAGDEPIETQAEPLLMTSDLESAISEESTEETGEFNDEPFVAEQMSEAAEGHGDFVEDEITEDYLVEEVKVDDQLLVEPAVKVDRIEALSIEDADAVRAFESYVAEELSDAASDEAALWTPEEPEADSLSAADVPWLDSVVDGAVVEPAAQPGEPGLNNEPIIEAASAANSQGDDGLEATLLSLDALALPSGKSLEDISAYLRTAQTSSWRDVDSALDWLEASLTQDTAVAAPEGELDDIDLLERMPDDPDAVLAWLEQMAAEEEQSPAAPSESHSERSDVITTSQPADSFVEELAEADLLAMPDDPDEAMVWLESLAQGHDATGEGPTAVAMDATNSEAELPLAPEAPAEDLALASAYVSETEPPTTEQIEGDTSFDPLEGLSEDDLDLILEGEPEQAAEDIAPEIVSAMEVVEQTEEPAILESPASETPEAAQATNPARKRGRAQPAAHQEEPPASPPPAPAAPERAAPSWVDLLKPLE